MGFIWFYITPDQTAQMKPSCIGGVIHIVFSKTPIKSLWFMLFETMLSSNWVDNLSHPKA